MLEAVREPSGVSPGAIAVMRANQAAAKRATARRRIHARVLHPIDVPHLVRDPLARRRSRVGAAFEALRLLSAAFGLHLLGLIVVIAAGRLLPDRPRFAPAEPLKVRVVETPPPDLAPPTPEEPEPSRSKAPEPEPDKPQSRSVQDTAQPPPPEGEQAEPANDADPIPLVGLSLESTISGSGPTFATGTSRMGTTPKKMARDTGARAAPRTAAPPSPSTMGTQRAATQIPTRDVKLEKPKRLQRRQPGYPANLRAQGIEGSVLVKVSIDSNGVVQEASVLRGSGHSEFDNAALSTARAERFAPATRDGKPVPYTLTYSYHFRIED